MRYAGLAFAAFLLVSQPFHAPAEDRAKTFVIGTYLGNEMQPDDSNNNSSPLHRTYYVRTEDGTWSMVVFADITDTLTHSFGGVIPAHFRSGDRTNLLDSLKHGEKFAFRIEPDRRIGASKNSFHVYIPRADDPKKEDKFDGELTPVAVASDPKPNDNVKALCDAHQFTPDQEKQYCGNQ